MEPSVLTTDMIIVFGLLGLAIFLFVFDLLRVDLVGLLMMVVLPLSGVIEPEEAIAGLSSNAVVSIIAVMILGAGLNKTGVMNVVAAQIVKIAGSSEARSLIRISERGVSKAVLMKFPNSDIDQIIESNGLTPRSFRKNYAVDRLKKETICIFQATYARTDRNADALGVCLVDLDATVL